jgi:hypothetical protein
MSSSTLSALSGIAPVRIEPIFAAAQIAGQQQPTTEPAPAFNTAQPILMVPTKPPLSPAVMAELIGQQTSPYGSVIGGPIKDQRPADGANEQDAASL